MNDEKFHSQIKTLYHPPKNQFSIIDVPEIRYMMIDGKGDPDKTGIKAAMQWLWSISHFLIPIAKQHLKKNFAYPPIECLFWASHQEDFITGRKDKWQWRVMLVLANFLTEEFFNTAVTQSEEKHAEKAPEGLRIAQLNEGRSVQYLHVGDYSKIADICMKLYTRYLPENNLRPSGKYHEIYLNDPAQTAPENRKIIIRQPVRALQ